MVAICWRNFRLRHRFDGPNEVLRIMLVHTQLQRGFFATIVIVLGFIGVNSKPNPMAAFPLQPPLADVPAKELDEPQQALDAARKAEFLKVYGLKEGEILKRMAAPFPACRKPFCESLKAQIGDVDVDEMVLSYVWDGKNMSFGSATTSGNGPVGWALISILHDLGVPIQEIEGDSELLRQRIEGEFVVRAGVPPEKLVPRFERILREELKLPIHLTLTQAERKVMICSGKYKSHPLPNRQANAIDLFAVKADDNSGAGGGNGTFDEFLAATGGFIGRRLVNGLTEMPRGPFRWDYYSIPQVPGFPDPNKEAEGVLKNVTAQTGLTFKADSRKVRVLLVEKK